MPDTTIRSNAEVLIERNYERHFGLDSKRTTTRFKIEIFED
jgi:hypothetical protein